MAEWEKGVENEADKMETPNIAVQAKMKCSDKKRTIRKKVKAPEKRAARQSAMMDFKQEHTADS